VLKVEERECILNVECQEAPAGGKNTAVKVAALAGVMPLSVLMFMIGVYFF
jgi:hypothetical protein